ncbi:Transcription factor HBP-1a [Olea europaea subsp. europaea]|uniref:Transcription factor HBP-1a n=1 Tax=Olea europaea subsp. europaea TaxID=158383 RepID=A0A8S0SLR8_OLEEU|nr:Transcription factor HBP-1a [Olea europaea subsp. europaea]
MRDSTKKSEMDKSSKEVVKETKESRTFDLQAQNSATSGTVTAEWAAYQVPPHAFLASSPQPHPYIWGVQPNTPGYMELDGKSSEGNEKLPNKVSEGNLSSLNMVIGKDTEPGKTSGASANGVHSKSGEIASEGSGEGSDASSQDMKSGGLQDSAETSENGSADHGSHNGGRNTPHSMVNQDLAIMPTPATGVCGWCSSCH